MTTTELGAVTQIVHFLNQPAVKEGVKNIASTAAFTFGLIEAYDLYQIVRGGEISAKITSQDSQWMQLASKAALLVGYKFGK